MKRALASLFLLVLIFAGAWMATEGRGLFFPARREMEGNTLLLTGVVEAREVDLRAEVGGVVLGVAAEEGDRVEAGAELCRIEEDRLAAEVEMARGVRDEAAARLALLRAGARAEEVEVARGRVALAEVALADADRELRRLIGLHQESVASAEALDHARAVRDEAEASLAVARSELALVQAGARPEEVRAAEAAVAAAEARLDAARIALAKARVAAPIAGTVLRRYVEPGELVQPGALLLTLADLDRLEVKVYLREPHLGRVRVGTPVAVSCDAWPGRAFPGRVARLATEAEFTPTNLQTPEDRVKLVFEATCLIDPTDGAVLPGMPVDVRIDLGAAEAPGGGGPATGRGVEAAR